MLFAYILDSVSQTVVLGPFRHVPATVIKGGSSIQLLNSLLVFH